MQLVTQKIKKADLLPLSKKMFGNLVKAVVDVEKEIMAIDSELHSDQEKFLISNGSLQNNVWGINLYPDQEKDAFIEFDSMINLRPSLGNNTRSVEDKNIQQEIIRIVNKLVE